MNTPGLAVRKRECPITEIKAPAPGIQIWRDVNMGLALGIQVTNPKAERPCPDSMSGRHVWAVTGRRETSDFKYLFRRCKACGFRRCKACGCDDMKIQSKQPGKHRKPKWFRRGRHG